MGAREVFVERDVGGLDREFATFGHRIAGVDGQVHDDLIDLSWIGAHGADGGTGHHHKVDVLADHAGQHFKVFGDDFVQIENFRSEHLLAAEGEQLASKRSGSL